MSLPNVPTLRAHVLCAARAVRNDPQYHGLRAVVIPVYRSALLEHWRTLRAARRWLRRHGLILGPAADHGAACCEVIVPLTP